jgi:hypothetical protein|nr:hypothetical protein [Neorhizobium tomejilense]
MTNLAITHDFVRKLAKNIRTAYGKDIPNTKVIEMIADALGRQAGPLMHALKNVKASELHTVPAVEPATVTREANSSGFLTSAAGNRISYLEDLNTIDLPSLIGLKEIGKAKTGLEVEIDCDTYDSCSISSFCDRVVAIVGSVAASGIQTYEVRGGTVVACDVCGSAGSVSLTMFPSGKTNIPGDAEFTAGRLGGAPDDVELEFSVRDFATAKLICTRLATSLVFNVNADHQALIGGVASLRPPCGAFAA